MVVADPTVKKVLNHLNSKIEQVLGLPSATDPFALFGGLFNTRVWPSR